jgi:hypothetical protein
MAKKIYKKYLTYPIKSFTLNLKKINISLIFLFLKPSLRILSTILMFCDFKILLNTKYLQSLSKLNH